MSAAATGAADPDDELTPEERRQRREYDETRRRRQRLEEAGFVFGTVQEFLALSDEENGKVEQWASRFPWARDRDLVWLPAARKAVENLPAASRLPAGRLLRSCQQGERFNVLYGELERSDIFGYLWRCPVPPACPASPLFVGFENIDAFWLLDVRDSGDVDKDSICRWQALRMLSYTLGRGYASLRERAGQLAAELDDLFAQPYEPKRLPPLPLASTARANRPPMTLPYSLLIRTRLRPQVLAAWKLVSGKGADPRLAERNRIVSEYMRQAFGIEDAAQTLRLEAVRREQRRSRADAAADLLGPTVQVRALTNIRYGRQQHARGSLFEYPAIVYLDSVWGAAKSRGRAYLPAVAVGGTRKGDKALQCTDLLLYVGGYQRPSFTFEPGADDPPLFERLPGEPHTSAAVSMGPPAEPTDYKLARIRHLAPVGTKALIALVGGGSHGSAFAQRRKTISILIELDLLQSTKAGKHRVYELGDGPHASLRFSEEE